MVLVAEFEIVESLHRSFEYCLSLRKVAMAYFYLGGLVCCH